LAGGSYYYEAGAWDACEDEEARRLVAMSFMKFGWGWRKVLVLFAALKYIPYINEIRIFGLTAAVRGYIKWDS
jgi:hypothetical protein